MTDSLTIPLTPNLQNINGDPLPAVAANNASELDQGDFLRLLMTQLQQQDPLEPVDNKEMLAQMAQFSALAGSAETNSALANIAGKLDALIDAQKATLAAHSTPAPTTTDIKT